MNKLYTYQIHLQTASKPLPVFEPYGERLRADRPQRALAQALKRYPEIKDRMYKLLTVKEGEK